MKTVKKIFLAMLLTLSGITFAACSKPDDNKGPMEKAGKAADEALEKAKERTGQAMEKAGETIKEAGEKMRGSGEKAGKQ
jgi:hypothetical protein